MSLNQTITYVRETFFFVKVYKKNIQHGILKRPTMYMTGLQMQFSTSGFSEVTNFPAALRNRSDSAHNYYRSCVFLTSRPNQINLSNGNKCQLVCHDCITSKRSIE